MLALNMENIDYSDASSIAGNFVKADKPARTEILKNFVEQNPNKALFFFKARKIAGLLGKNAPYALLKEYETTIARLKYPNRKNHLLAGYFYSRHYEDRMDPYLQKIKQLKKQGNARAETLMPVVADMVEKEGYDLAREYFDQVGAGQKPDEDLKKALVPLSKIESAVSDIQTSVGGRPSNNAEMKKKWEVIRRYFDDLYEKGWAPLFIARTKKNEVLKRYSGILESYLDFRNKKSEKGSKISAGKPSPLQQEAAPRRAARPEVKTTSAPPKKQKPSLLSRSGSIKVKEKKLLLTAIVNVFKQMPTQEVEDMWLDFINQEPLVREGERQELALMIEDARFQAEIDKPTRSENEERKKQIERYMNKLTADFNKSEEVSAKLKIINRYKSFRSNSIIEKIKTIYEILLKRVKSVKSTREAAVRIPPTKIGETEELSQLPIDELEESFEDFLAVNQKEMDSIAAFFQEQEKKISREFDDILQTEIPELKFNRAAEAHESELFSQYREQLRQMLNQQAGFGDFIYSLEKGPLKDMAPWEQKDFFNEIITAVKKSPDITSGNPDIIQKLINYRDNKLAQPNLLEMVFNNLKKIKGSYPFDIKRAIKEQIKYLSERLKDEKFQPARLSIYRIYQNVLYQALDENIMEEITREPAWKQVLILKSLKQCLANKPEVLSRIDKMLADAELSSILEKMDEESARSEKDAAEVQKTTRILDKTLHDLRNALSIGLSSQTSPADGAEPVVPEPEAQGVFEKSDEYNLEVLFEDVEPLTETEADKSYEELFGEVEAAVEQQTTATESKENGSREKKAAAELEEINKIAAAIFSDIGNDGRFDELGQVLGRSIYLSFEQEVNEIAGITEDSSEETSRGKFNDILEVSKRMRKEIDSLLSISSKIVNLQFWIDNDYIEAPHIQEFLKGQIAGYEKARGGEGGLLERLFSDLRGITEPQEKISYLKEKLDDPEYKNLTITVQNLIDDIQKAVNLEPEDISKEWIDRELAGLKESPEAQLDWLKRRRYLGAYRAFSDHMDQRMAEAEERIPEKALIDCVKSKLGALKEGEKPLIYDNVNDLTRAVLKESGAGKKQQIIIEQETLKPLDKKSLFGRERRVLFYLMSSSSEKPEDRVKALAGRLKLSFSEKQEYLSLVKNALMEIDASETDNYCNQLGLTPELVSYYAVYILGFDKPPAHRIKYVERFRDDTANENCLNYKKKFNLSPPDFNKVIKDLQNILQAQKDSAEYSRPYGEDESTVTSTEKTGGPSALPGSEEIDKLFTETKQSPLQVLEGILRKQPDDRASIDGIQRRIETRIINKGEELNQDKEEKREIQARVEKITGAHESEQGYQKNKNMLSSLLTELLNYNTAALPRIIEDTFLPELTEKGNTREAAVIRAVNENIFLPALRGSNVEPAEAKDYGVEAEDVKTIAAILGNIRRIWQEQVKAEIDAGVQLEKKGQKAAEQEAGAGSLAGILSYLDSLSPETMAIELRRSFIDKPKLEKLSNKLETLESLLQGKINPEGLEALYGENAPQVRKLINKLKDFHAEAENFLYESKPVTHIPGEIRQALTGLSSFENPHLLISKVSEDERFKGGNRENRDAALNQLLKEGQIFSYNSATYIGHGKMEAFVFEMNGLKGLADREKRLFAEKLTEFMLRFKTDQDRYNFLGIKEGGSSKKANEYKRLMKIISGPSLKEKAGAARADKAPAAVKSGMGKGVKAGGPGKIIEKKIDAVRRPKKKKAVPKEISVKRAQAPASKALNKKASAELNNIRSKFLQDSSRIITRSLKKLIILSKKSDPALFNKLYALYLSSKASKADLINLMDSNRDRALIASIQRDDYLLANLTFDRKSILKLFNKLK